MKKIFAWICIALILSTQIIGYAAGTPSAVINVKDSVVRIVVETPYGTGFGTGFAIGKQKPVQYIVTNHHVIEDANKISVLLSRDNMIEAYVQTSLEGSDLAVLKLSTPLHDVEPVVVNDKHADVGSRAYALGYPITAASEVITGNKEDIVVTDGIISSLQTVPYISGLQPVNVYLIDASLTEGNSGGPLVNSKGEVIGINSWSVTDSQAINACIRTEDLTAVLSQNGIPYLKSQSMNIMWILLTVAILFVIAAIAFMIYMVMKNRKQPKPVLYGISGEFAGERFYLPNEGVNIGRDAAICQIVLPLDSPKVSRSHCNVRYNPNDRTFILTDLTSANGTFLFNGVQLQPKAPTIVASGTKFFLGDETTVFRVGIED